MNSVERHEARYQRRKAAREQKRSEILSEYLDYDKVFSYEHLYHSYKMCRKNVAWKASVQRYISNAPLYVMQIYEKLRNGTYKSDGFYEFDIFERGKTRHIRSVKIDERVVQRCLCDYCLVPVLSRSFVYDNGASLKNKGYHFTIKRLEKHLEDYYKEHGNEGYILCFDFSKYFDNVSHDAIKRILAKYITDERLLNLAYHFVEMFGDKGIGLGSQISQVLALAIPNEVDHYIKEGLQIKGYGRYMDDGYMIHPSKEYLNFCLDTIRDMLAELGITINEKKTQIVKISHGFKFMQMKIFLLADGTVIKRIPRESVTRVRRKLKKLFRFFREGKIKSRDIYTAYRSWKAYALQFNSYRTVKAVTELYNILMFGGLENVLQG